MAALMCENCNGVGVVPIATHHGDAESSETCPVCDGTGRTKTAWTFCLEEMEIVESNKGETETVVRFGGDSGIEVICKINWPWPYHGDPPAAGSRYKIDFRSVEEETGE